jgi:hypothetical protein
MRSRADEGDAVALIFGISLHAQRPHPSASGCHPLPPSGRGVRPPQNPVLFAPCYVLQGRRAVPISRSSERPPRPIQRNQFGDPDRGSCCPSRSDRFGVRGFRQRKDEFNG